MPFTNYGLQAILTNILGNSASAATPATYYLALSTTSPAQAKGSGTFWNFTEPTAGTGAYARLSITNNTTNFTAIASEPTSGYSIQNNVTFTMATSTAAWSTGATPLVAGGLWDASSGGNLWAYGSLSPTVTVNQAGVAVTFTAAQLIAAFT